MGLKDLVKGALFQDDEGKKPAPAKDPPPSSPPQMSVVPSPMDLPVDTDLYQALLAKTQYTNTPVGSAIHKYTEALAGVPLDESMKLKAAIGQAKKLDNIADDAVLGSFDAVRGWLQHEEELFSESASAATADQVVARQKRLDELNAEVKAKQEEIVHLAQELTEAQSHLTNLSTQFKSAAARRRAEIEQEYNRYAAALKG